MTCFGLRDAADELEGSNFLLHCVVEIDVPTQMTFTAAGVAGNHAHEAHESGFAHANLTIAILGTILFLTLLFEVGRRCEMCTPERL